MFHTCTSNVRFAPMSGVVVIPWRGFGCFTPMTRSPRTRSCSRMPSCNPLAGIWVFHTLARRGRVLASRVGNAVVIPWRGFGCFTHRFGSVHRCGQRYSVVIPWRGFRCFTLRTDRRRRAGISTNVVIPWRGFRCFTHRLPRNAIAINVYGCNPLAGI